MTSPRGAGPGPGPAGGRPALAGVREQGELSGGGRERARGDTRSF